MKITERPFEVENGRIVSERVTSFNITPPHPDACQVCGMHPAHPLNEPHHLASLYYQWTFYGEHGRWPTWADAIAHCPPGIQNEWIENLRRLGLWPAWPH